MAVTSPMAKSAFHGKSPPMAAPLEGARNSPPIRAVGFLGFDQSAGTCAAKKRLTDATAAGVAEEG